MRTPTRTVLPAAIALAVLLLVLAFSAVALATEGNQSTDALKSWTLPSGWAATSRPDIEYVNFAHAWTDAEPWKAEILVDVHTPGDLPLAFTSQADFETWAKQVMAALVEAPELDRASVEETMLGGYPAWRISASRFINPDIDPDLTGHPTQAYRYKCVVYCVRQVTGSGYASNGDVWIQTTTNLSWIRTPGESDHAAEIEALSSVTEEIVRSFKYWDMAGATPANGAPPTAPTSAGGLPWRTIVDGALALAAAAAALVGAFLSTPEGRRRAKNDPTVVVGYLLQLSAPSLQITRDGQTPLEVTVWRVRANGSTEHAPDAAITASASEGAAVSPSSGYGTLRIGVWQTGTIKPPGGLIVSAQTADGGTSSTVALSASDAAGLKVSFEPADKNSVIANEKDSVTLVARVAPVGGGEWPAGVDTAALRASIEFKPADDRWLIRSDAVDWGNDGRAVRIQAHQPDPLHAVAPPDHIDVEISAVGATGVQLRKVVPVLIARPPVLLATPDNVTLTEGSTQSARVKLEMRDPGKARWTYQEQWPKDTRPLVKCAFVEDSASTGTLTLSQSDDLPDTAPTESPHVSAKLTVIASAKGYDDVPRDIDVAITKEGLFAETMSRHPDGTYHVRADGKKNPQTIVFRAYVSDPATGQIAATRTGIDTLKFEAIDDPDTDARASADFSQLAIAYRPAASAAEHEPGAAYSFAFTREVPGKGEVRPIRYLVTAPGLDPDKYWCEIKLGLETTALEQASPEWQAEYQRALNIIQRFMPASYYPQWKQTLDKRSKFLGVEGMVEFRKRIWFNAAELVFAQGAEGYVEQMNWENYAVQSLQIVDVIGDIAFMYLCSRFLGPAAGEAAMTVKPIMTSAIGEYLAGTSADDWVHMQIDGLGGMLSARATDINAWEKLSGAKRWKLWAIFVFYHWAKGVWQGKSSMDTLKAVAEQAGGAAVMGWIQKKLHQYAGSTPYAGTPVPTTKPLVPPRKRVIETTDTGTMPKPGKPVRPQVPTRRAPGPPPPESPAAARIRANTRIGPDGVPMADRATVIDTMRDAIAVRTLKTASPETQAAFNNTRNQIYREHDAAVLRDLRAQPDMAGRRLAVVDVRTPGSDPDSLNTDRDFRVVEIRRNPVTGAREAIEIDPDRWRCSSDRAFARATGGPADDPRLAHDYAKEHQQRGTDRYDAEASPDLAMQAYVQDPSSKQWRQAQIKPNIQLVAEGKNTLHDPEALGKTYETKVNDATQLGDKYVQAGKAVDTMMQARAGYAKQRYDVGELPPDLKRGMAIVGQGEEHFADPQVVADVDARLRAANFEGGLPQFMRAVSSQIQSLGNAKLRQ